MSDHLPTSGPLIFDLDAKLYTSTISILLGEMANWILYGVLLVQFYLYYVAFPKDPRVLKLVVCAQLLLESTQTASSTYDVVHHFTLAYTHPDLINEVGNIWISIPLMIGLMALIGLLSLGQLSAAIWTAIQEKNAGLLNRLLSQNNTVTAISVWGFCSLACDVLIAAIMTYYLKKRDTGFKNTHSIVQRCIRLSIETGCVTALSAGVLAVLVLLPGHPPYYAAVSAIVAKTYSNSMMAMLNSRIKPVSNALAPAVPTWNESVRPPVRSQYSTVIFRRRSDVELDQRISSDSQGSEVVSP